MFEGIHFLAALVASAVALVAGWLYYSPVLFGKKWMRLEGLSKNDPAMKKGMMAPMIGMLAAGFIKAIGLYFVFTLAGIVGYQDGIVMALLLAVVFVLTTQLGPILWKHKSAKLFVLNGVFALIEFIILAVVVVAMVM